MKSPLNTYQRRFAEHSIVFGARLLSPDLRQSLFRASLACAENGKTETGVIDFICGLYLQNPDEIVRYFRGDFSALISRNFPVHRFGGEGLMLNVMRDQKHPGYGTCASPKLCPCAFSTAWIIAIHRPTAIRAAHVLHHRGPKWNNAPSHSYSSEPSARKPRSSVATHCAQAQASQATDCCAR